MSLDLAAYLRRIGVAGPLPPTLESVRAIVRAHAAAIPFENLDPLLRRPVRLDVPSLEAKLVHGGRGGYCFEHNGVLREALVALGFTVTGLGARVLWNQPEGALTARTHMLLRVEHDNLDGPHIADVGFGGQVLTGVLRLEPDVAQETPHEPFRLRHDGRHYTMQSLIAGEWKTLYRFDLEPQLPIDYEVASHYTATHPASHFTSTLIAARALPGKRLALRNRQLAVHHLGDDSERRTIDSADEMLAVLEDDFGITVPDAPALAAAFQRLA